MRFEFETTLLEEGNRTFAPIPFNVWEKTGQKGNVPCRVDIHAYSFECKLLPKGCGMYWIPIGKKIARFISHENPVTITLEPIESLTRIIQSSPYSKENPIRKIDAINPIAIRPGFCGQCCVAMLADVSLDSVIELMGKSHASWSKILEALDYYGISYAEKAVYPKGKAFSYPQCCIVNNDNGFVLWYQGAFYGCKDIDNSKTRSFREILVP